MSSNNSEKFLDLFTNIDEYKQVNRMKILLFEKKNDEINCLFRRYVRKLLMLFEHQID
jgi:hypothetical protein